MKVLSFVFVLVAMLMASNSAWAYTQEENDAYCKKTYPTIMGNAQSTKCNADERCVFSGGSCRGDPAVAD